MSDTVSKPLDSDPRALATAFYAAFSNNDVATVENVVDKEWQDIPLAPGQPPGRDGVRALLATLHSAFSDFKITVEQLVTEDDAVAARALITGVHSGAFLGVPPTAKRVTIPIHEFHTIRDGRIARTAHMEDLLGFLTQVGASGPAGET